MCVEKRAGQTIYYTVENVDEGLLNKELKVDHEEDTKLIFIG